MVATARTSVRASSLKFLNSPREVRTRLDESGLPVDIDMSAFDMTGRRGRRTPAAQWVAIRSVDDKWKVGPDEWWRGEAHMIERMYFELRLEDERRLTVFRDMVNGGWFRQEDV